jgi:hypothetical protein
MQAGMQASPVQTNALTATFVSMLDHIATRSIIAERDERMRAKNVTNDALQGPLGVYHNPIDDSYVAAIAISGAPIILGAWKNRGEAIVCYDVVVLSLYGRTPPPGTGRATNLAEQNYPENILMTLTLTAGGIIKSVPEIRAELRKWFERQATSDGSLPSKESDEAFVEAVRTHGLDFESYGGAFANGYWVKHGNRLGLLQMLLDIHRPSVVPPPGWGFNNPVPAWPY